MTPAGSLLILLLTSSLAVLLAVVVFSSGRRAMRGATAPGAGAGAPSCGACGYDTTGLTSLTCPECGADLRAVGITRGRRAGALRGFVASALVMLAAWLFCGVASGTVVNQLLPARLDYEHEVRLTNPASAAYAAAVVKARSTAWGKLRPTVTVRADLERAAKPGGAAPLPPPPLVLDPKTGGYEYVDAAGNRVSRPSDFDVDAVLAWLSSAGADAGDARVREEAKQIWLALLRAGRNRRMNSPVGGGIGSTTVTSQGAFGNMRVAERSLPTRNHWGRVVFLVAWFAVFFAGLRYLSRSPPRRAAQSRDGGAPTRTET